MSDTALKAIAIDDEQHCLETLKYELDRHCSGVVELIDEITDPEIAKTKLKNTDIDLLFLDVNLQSTTGIRLLEELLPVSFEVIFVTAYDEFALKAFELSAAHYLMKPVNGKKLKDAVEKVRKIRNNEISGAELAVLIKKVHQELRKADKIALNVQDGIEFIDPREIIFIEGDSNYSTIVLEDGRKIVVSRTLKSLEENTLPSSFLRIHKSYIVNISKMKKYVKTDGGHILMTNDKKLPISRNRKHILNEIFGG